MATKKADAAREGISHTVEGLETVMKNGTEQFRTGFEKAVKNYDQFLGYAETLHNELYAYSRQSIEDTLAATKAILASKSVHEAFELQTDFAKSAFDAYVGKVSKLSEIMTAATKETLEPIQGRYQAWVEVVQNNRAA
ncbi:MAG: TIGR01841 family phasin [Alphaproteobacteria bacterium]|nr:TIGR01841 family phasin [Alphaproteobacteria bacterium]